MLNLIHALPSDALPLLEHMLSAVLAEMRRRPDFRTYTEVLDARDEARQDAFAASLKVALAALAAGAAEGAVLADICRRPPHPAPAYAAFRLAAARRAAARAARADRDAGIAQLTRAGYGNAGIAAAAGCSVATAAKVAARSKGPRK